MIVGTTTKQKNDGMPDIDLKSIMLTHNLPYNKDSVPYYDRLSRFGVMDPYNKLTYGKEYLFFTKPDLHIYKANTTELQSALSSDPFFVDLANRHPNVIGQLQKSAGSTTETADQIMSPFMNLLSNSVSNTLDLQGLTAGTMDTPANMWGGSNTYRKDAWLGDEQIEFSLEFEDKKTLDIYYLLKAYEMYHRYMMAGYIYPPNITSVSETNGDYYDAYTSNKELHTTFGIYRFIVDDDYSTLLYWAYICGAYFVNQPRDGFNGINGTVSDGLKYAVDFKAFCVDDMNPVILSNFNKIVRDAYGSSGYFSQGVLNFINSSGTAYSKNLPQNFAYDSLNGEWPLFPLVLQVDESKYKNLGLPTGMKHAYRLEWFRKGTDPEDLEK